MDKIKELKIKKHLSVIYGLQSIYIKPKNTFILYQLEENSDFSYAFSQASNYIKSQVPEIKQIIKI